MKYAALAFSVYLLAVNIWAFALMGIDKRRSRRAEWRIPERRLFASAVLGGGIGAICGMRVFRHKTKHASFLVGMPLILVAQLVLAGFVIKFLFFRG